MVERSQRWIEMRRALVTSARATVAILVSLVLARSLKLPEFYWAPISTIVVLLSTTDPLTLAWQRFAGTALGGVLGAGIGTLFPLHWYVYGASIFICGLLCWLFRLEAAYRFAAITLSIILLVTHGRPAWIVAIDRCIEVTLGIAVALVMAEIWRK